MSNCQVSIYSGVEVFREFRDELKALWVSCDEATEAQDVDWQLLYQQKVSVHSKPFLVIARSPEGQMLAAAAVSQHRKPFGLVRYLGFIGEHDNDYHVVIHRSGIPIDVGAQLFHAIFKLGKSRISLVELLNIPDNSWTAEALRLAIAQRNEEAAACNLRKSKTYRIILPHTTEEYWSILNPNARRRFQYEMRRLHRDFNVHLRVPDNEAELELAISDIVKVHRSRWGFTSMTHHPRDGDFFKEMIRMLHIDRKCLLFLMDLDGKCAAFNLGIILGNRICFPCVCHDPNFPKKYSVGLMNNLLVIERCISDGFGVYDLTRGGEGYKQLLGAECFECLSCTIVGSPLTQLAASWDLQIGKAKSQTIGWKNILSINRRGRPLLPVAVSQMGSGPNK